MISERGKWGKPWDHHRYWPVGTVCTCGWAEEREKLEFSEAEGTGICESVYQRGGSYTGICTGVPWVCCWMLSYGCLWLNSMRLGVLVVPRYVIKLHKAGYVGGPQVIISLKIHKEDLQELAYSHTPVKGYRAKVSKGKRCMAWSHFMKSVKRFIWWGTEASNQALCEKSTWEQILQPQSSPQMTAAPANILSATAWKTLSQNHQPKLPLDFWVLESVWDNVYC